MVLAALHRTVQGRKESTESPRGDTGTRPHRRAGLLIISPGLNLCQWADKDLACICSEAGEATHSPTLVGGGGHVGAVTGTGV